MPASASDVALQLVQRRVDGNPCADAKQLRVIPTREVALEVQQAMIKIAASGAATGPVFPAGLGKHVGWKIGGWPTAGVLGPLFENVVLPSPATASLAEQNMGTLEAELGFVLKAGLPPREAPYTEEEVWAATSKCFLAIEACALRCGPPFKWLTVDEGCDANYKLADACVNAIVVVGPDLSVDQVRAANIPSVAARLLVNGEVKSQGTGAEVKGSPVASLCWLADQGSSSGGLKAGDVIITGAFCKLPSYSPGDQITAEFQGLGEVVLGIKP